MILNAPPESLSGPLDYGANVIREIIHQTAKTAQIPERWRSYQRRVRELYPQWEYRLWTDEDNLALVRSRMPDFEDAYLGAPLNIMRADLIRYLIMDIFGGLYLDFDYEFLKPFNFNSHHLVLPRESDDDKPLFVGNSVLASEPGHPFWRAVLRDYQASFPKQPRDPEEEDIINLTGPGLLTRVYTREFSSDPSIHIPPRQAFNPPIPRTEEEYQVLKSKESVAYGIHHCDGTWRALTYPQKIVKRLKRIGKRIALFRS